MIPFLYESMFRLEVQIKIEEKDLITARGIAAHYSGREFVTGFVGSAMPSGKISRGKIVCLNNANIELRSLEVSNMAENKCMTKPAHECNINNYLEYEAHECVISATRKMLKEAIEEIDESNELEMKLAMTD